MRKAPSLGQLSGAWDALNWPKGAQSSSTKLASYLPKPRSLCCAFCRNTNSSVSAELAPSELMFGLLRPLTATWRPPSRQACSGATYFTGSTFFRLRCHLFEKEEETSPFDITDEYTAPDCLTKYIPRSPSSPDLRNSAGYWRNHRRAHKQQPFFLGLSSR